MKNILLILLLCPLTMYGQTTFTLVANTNSVSINNDVRPVGSLVFNCWNNDTTKIEINLRGTGGNVVYHTAPTSYKRSTGVSFTNWTAIKAWADSNAFPTASSATGTVTSITAGTGLSGGVITTTGTISMPATGTAGTYGDATHIPSVTTDAQGRVSGVTTYTFSSGGGTVTSTSVVTANGFSGTVATPTTTPAITINQTSIGSAVTATTQTAGDNSTKIATTAYADAAGSLTITVSLTSAQFSNINSVPYTIVPAPGVGKIIQVLGAIYNYTAVTTGYNSVAFGLYEIITGFAICNVPVSNTLITGTTSGIRNMGMTAATVAGGTLVANSALVLYALSNPTTGDGTFNITVTYKILSSF